MKRILMTGIFCVLVSMFFTGCSPLLSTLDKDAFQAIEWKVDDYKENEEQWETEVPESDPEYYEINKDEKFKDLEGERAFKIKDGHSQLAEDMEIFEIGGYKEGGTFLYTYATKTTSGSMVHCAATYNYKTKNFRVFHENIYERTDQNLESLYMQVLDGGNGDIFIYDNGSGYLYNSSLELKLHVVIEEFVREHFDEGFSLSITNALADGQDRIYVNLVIEKEEIEEPEEDSEEEEISEEEADEEAEELDKEITDKTIELVLVYDLIEVTGELTGGSTPTIDQRNLNFDTQKEEWKEMTENKVYSSEPDALDDWNTVKHQYPDQWGNAFIYKLNESYWNDARLRIQGLRADTESGTPIREWKASPQFEMKKTYICTFKPVKNNDKNYTDVKSNSELDNIYITYNDKYYEVSGKIGEMGNPENPYDTADYNSETISREYTYEWTETSTDSDGNREEETKQETRTQTIDVYKNRDAGVDNFYLEGYWTLDEKNIDSVIAVVKDRVLCMMGKLLVWLQKDGTVQIFTDAQDDMIIDVHETKDAAYLMLTYTDSCSLYKIDTTKMNWYSRPILESLCKINNSEYGEMLEPQTARPVSIDQDFADLLAEDNDMDNPFGQAEGSGGEVLKADTILPVSLDKKKDKLERIEGYGMAAGSDSATGKGYLVTTMTKGIVYRDMGSEKLIALDGGTWYNTWKDGDRYISAGFPKEGYAYSASDAAFSVIMEWSLDELYGEALDSIAKALMEYNMPEVPRETSEYGDINDYDTEEETIYLPQ